LSEQDIVRGVTELLICRVPCKDDRFLPGRFYMLTLEAFFFAIPMNPGKPEPVRHAVQSPLGMNHLETDWIDMLSLSNRDKE